MESGSTGQPKPLDYAPASDRRRWGRALRRFILATVVLLILLAVRRWGPTYWERAQLLYWQHRCAIYVGDPQQEPALGFSPNCWREYTNGPVREPGGRYDGAEGTGDGPSNSMYFLHERSKDGMSRIVAVHAQRLSTTRLLTDPPDVLPVHEMAFDYNVAGPMSWITRYGEDTGGTSSGRNIYLGPARVAKVFHGQPDPVDPSRFTIRYELDGKSGVIEGWLETPDSLRLRVRDGPAKEFNLDE